MRMIFGCCRKQRPPESSLSGTSGCAAAGASRWRGFPKDLIRAVATSVAATMLVGPYSAVAVGITSWRDHTCSTRHPQATVAITDLQTPGDKHHVTWCYGYRSDAVKTRKSTAEPVSVLTTVAWYGC